MRKILVSVSLFVFMFFLTSCVNPQTQITISFETNGGNEIEDLVVSSSSSSLNLPTPVKEGFEFDGWFTDTEFNVPFTIGAFLTNTNLTLFAKWTSLTDQLTITFDVDGGTAVAPLQIASGTTVTAPSEPTKTGFTFDGWYTDNTFQTAFLFTTTISSNTTIYAKWSPVVATVVVTFDVDGGSSVVAQTINSGTKAILPTAPTKIGYTFGGWYQDSAKTITYDFNTNVSTNITIYAKWTINTFNVTFNVDGGSVVPVQVVNYNSKATLPTAPTKVGYTFGGWYANSDKTISFDFNTLITANTTVYAKWTINTFTVTFDVDSGSVITPQVVNYNTLALLPTAPLKTGYTFGGWYQDSAKTISFDFNTFITVNTTIYAKWNIVTYTLTFDVDGGSSIATQTLDYNVAPTIPLMPTKVGYTFDGWYADSNKTIIYIFDSLLTTNTTAYAKWTINTFTVTFDVDSGSVVTAQVVNYNTLATLPAAPTKEHYTFGGWYTSSDKTTLFDFNTLITVNTTIYAKWNIVTYTLTFDVDGGSSVATQTLDYNVTPTIPLMPAKVGHTFDGWYADSNKTVSYNFDNLLTSNSTAYAKWLVNTFTVTFDVDGGSAVSAQVVNYNTVALLPSEPTKGGNSFDGWYIDTEKTILFNFDTLITSNTTIYAKWVTGSTTITFVQNNGQSNIVVTGTIGTPIQYPDIPTKLGHTFAGWYADAVFIQLFTDLNMPSSNIVVYARLTVNNYTIVLEENGGSTVTDITAPYGSSISAPNNPTKTDYKFDGWYTDVDLTIVYTFTTMPLDGITLYAKWIDENSIQTISSVLAFAQHGDTIKVSGAVYAKLYPGPMIMGFYVYDGTGSLFIIADQTTLAIGDEVTITGTYSLTVGVPQIEVVSQVALNAETGIYAIPEIEEMSILEITQQDPANLSNYGTFVELTGILRLLPGGRFYLFDLTDSNGIEINYKSFSMGPDNPLIPFIDQVVTINAVIHLYVEMAGDWHILYHPDIVPISAPLLSDQEIVDQIVALGTTFLDGMRFPSGSVMKLPTDDDFFGATISFVTTGPNAALYDILTGQFAEVTVLSEVLLTFTVTLNAASASNTVTIFIVPVLLVDIADLYNLPLNEQYLIHGIVVFLVPEENIAVVADSTGFIITMVQTALELGDEIVLSGYLMQQGSTLMLVGEFGATVIEILSHDNPSPIPPIDLSIQQIYDLDPLNPQLSGLFIETTGTLIEPMDMLYPIPFGSQMYLLEDELGQLIPILAFSEESALLLKQHVDQYVFIRGFLSPTGDASIPFILIFNGRLDGVGSGLEPFEYLQFIMNGILETLDQTEVRQLATIKIPNIKLHPGVTLQLELAPSFEGLYNFVTHQFADVSWVQQVDFIITLYYEDLFLTDTFSVMIIPIETTSIADFLVGNPETVYTVRGVVILAMGDEFTLISDGITQLFILKVLDVKMGDEIIVSGKPLLYMSGFTVMSDDASTELLEIVSIGLPNPGSVLETTIALANAIDMTNPQNFATYVELRGAIMESSDGFMGIQITDGVNQIEIAAFGYWAFEHLMDYMGVEVYIRGYLFPNMGDESGDYDRFLIFNDNPGDLRIAYETDEEAVTGLLALAGLFLDGMVFRPLDYFYLFEYIDILDATIEWVAIGENAGMYDFDEQQFGATSIEKLITFEITITVGAASGTTTIGFSIVPLPVYDIGEVLALEDGTDVVVEGTVAFVGQYMLILYDEFGYLAIRGNFMVSIGDEVQIRGYKISNPVAQYVISYGFEHLTIVLNTNQLVPEIPAIYLIEDLLAVDFTTPVVSSLYVEVTGIIEQASEFGHAMVLAIGEHKILLNLSMDQIDSFYEAIGIQVTVKGYVYFDEYYYRQEDMYILISEADIPEVIEASIAQVYTGPSEAFYILDVYFLSQSDDLSFVYLTDSTGIIAIANNTIDYQALGYIGRNLLIAATKTVIEGYIFINPDINIINDYGDWFYYLRPPVVNKTIQEMSMLDYSNQEHFVTAYRTYGIIEKIGDNYRLAFGNYTLPITSIDPNTAYMIEMNVGDLIAIEYYLHYESELFAYEAYMLQDQSSFYPDLTPQQQLYVMSSYISDIFNDYNTVETSYIPFIFNLWGTYDVTIEWSVDAADAALFDVFSGYIGEVEATTFFTLYFTLGIYYDPSLTVELSFQIGVVNIVPLPILDFITTSTGYPEFVEGIVVGMDVEELTILITDGFDYLYIKMDHLFYAVSLGSQIVLHGSYELYDNRHFMTGEITLYSTTWDGYADYEPYTPVEIADLLLESPTDASLYPTFVSIQGLIQTTTTPTGDHVFLQDSLGNTVKIIPGPATSTLIALNGYDVTIEGILYRYDDGLWVIYAIEFELKEYTTLEKMALIKQDLAASYENNLYRPTDEYYFITWHYVFYNAQIEWGIVGVNAEYAFFNDFEALEFTGILVDTIISLEATISIWNGVSYDIDTVIIQILVQPIVLSNMTDFLASAEGEWVTLEVIVLVNAHRYMYVYEPISNTIIYVNFGDWIAGVDQKIWLTGQKEIVNGRHQIAWGGFVEYYDTELSIYQVIPQPLTMVQLADGFVNEYYYDLIHLQGYIGNSVDGQSVYTFSYDGKSIYLDNIYGGNDWELNHHIGTYVSLYVFVYTINGSNVYAIYAEEFGISVII